MKEGYLVRGGSRPDIRYDDGTYYGGLHCGNVFEALIQNEWRTVRIEASLSKGRWYLIDPERHEVFVELHWMAVRK